MKRIALFLPLLAVMLLASCQRDNYYDELVPADLPKAALQPDGVTFAGKVAYPSVGEIPIALQNALYKRTSELGSNLVLDSEMAVFGPGFLTESGTAPSDTLIALAYRCGVIITVVHPDYTFLSSWCGKQGIVFPGVPGEYESPLLCAFSNRGWLYDMDDPRYRITSEEVDYNAWLNPFVAWVNAHLDEGVTPYVIGSGDELVFEQNLACQKYDHTWFLSLRDTVKVLSQMTSHFTCWPVTGADRDWFLCKAELSINNAPMFRGVGVSTGNGIRTKYSAYEMRKAGFRFDIGAGPQNADGFEQGPLPESTPAGESFQPDFDWTLPVSGFFTEGPVTARRSSALTAAIPPAHRGAVTATLPDLDVANNSGNGIIDYQFTVPSSLLGYMHRTEIYPSEAQICRSGRDDLQASWVWRCPQSDAERLLSVGVSAVYTSMFFRSDTVGAGEWADYGKAVDDRSTSPRRTIRLLSPGRVQTGQLQLLNDYEDAASCEALRFWAEGKDPAKDVPDYDALWSVVAPGSSFVRNMETGRYQMQFYKKSADGKKTWFKEGMVDITAAQATVISASDFLP